MSNETEQITDELMEERSSFENAENTEDTAVSSIDDANGAVDEFSAEAYSTAKKHRVRAPIIIAAMILLLAVTTALIWGGFFYKSIKGSWKYSVTVGEGGTATDYVSVISFEDDNVCRYYMGGRIYKGKYKLDNANGKSKVNVIFTEQGRQVQSNSFYYETTGNFFTHRTLYVTDLDGLVLSPDDISEQNEVTINLKKKLADSKEDNGKLYYIIPFSEVSDIDLRIRKYDDPKLDDKLIGTWYEANENSGYGYTFTFNADGTYEILFSDISYNGCYTVNDGICTYNLLNNHGEEYEREIGYKIENDRLVLDENGQTHTLVKTDNKYAFEGAIK